MQRRRIIKINWLQISGQIGRKQKYNNKIGICTCNKTFLGGISLVQIGVFFKASGHYAITTLVTGTIPDDNSPLLLVIFRINDVL